MAQKRGKKGGDDWSQADLRPSLKAVLRMLEVLLTDATASRTAMWPPIDKVPPHPGHIWYQQSNKQIARR